MKFLRKAWENEITNIWINVCWVSRICYRKRLWNIWKAQWKLSYLTVWFAGNGLAPITNKYRYFNAILMCSVMGLRAKMQFAMSEINTLMPRHNGRHFADNRFKCIFMNENAWILIKSSLTFVPEGPINNFPTLIQIMACRRSGDKPLSEPMMVPTYIWVTRPQWVKATQEAVQECTIFYTTYSNRCDYLAIDSLILVKPFYMKRPFVMYSPFVLCLYSLFHLCTEKCTARDPSCRSCARTDPGRCARCANGRYYIGKTGICSGESISTVGQWKKVTAVSLPSSIVTEEGNCS